MPQLFLAHGKWFVDPSVPFPVDWGFMFNPVSLGMVGGVGAVVAVWVAATRRLGFPDLPNNRWFVRLQPALPRLVAAALGITLITFAVTDSFLVPQLSLRHIPGGWAVALIEGLVGLWLITGVRLRQAAGALGVLAVIGLLLQGPVTVLETSHMWAIAGFLWMTGESDRPGFGRESHRGLRRGLLVLRLGVGTALIAAAVSEKLANPALATAILDAHPTLHLPRVLGVELDTATFIRMAASAEILFGLLVIAGVTPRAVAVITTMPLVVTVPLFGRTELLGHLPIYAALLALLVCGSTAAHRPRSQPRPADLSEADEEPDQGRHVPGPADSQEPVSVGATASSTQPRPPRYYK